MKFETYVYKIVLDHQPNFHKDPCKDARARGVNARTHVKKNFCVRSLGYIVGVSPHVCVLSLEDNLRWILACCLLRFAAFFFFP